MAFKEAAAQAAPALLEPIMKVEVTVPENYMGDVIGDLNSRRGKIHGDGCPGTVSRSSQPTFRLRKCSVMRPRFGP